MPMVFTPRTSWLYLRLAAQNLLRRPARGLLLGLTVAIAVGAAFTTFVLQQAIQESLSLGLSRMGADLLVVPRETLVNLTPALLTVEPATHTLNASLADKVARIPGVQSVAFQRHFPIQLDAETHGHDADLVAFDPERDFTVLPWLKEKLDRPLQRGDVLVGGRREEPIGATLRISGEPLTVYGRLGRTNVGLFDRACFVSFDTASHLNEAGSLSSATGETGRDLSQVSALLVRLEPGAATEQIRFALARHPELKVVAGTPLYTSVRQALSAVFGGALLLTVMLLAAAALMVSTLYSAILTERERELGLLLSLGTRPGQLMRLVVTEAMLTTGLGGICGVALGGSLLLLCQRSLGFYLQSVNLTLTSPAPTNIGLYALGGVLLASGVGLLGALIPAWPLSRREPFDLIRAEGH